MEIKSVDTKIMTTSLIPDLPNVTKEIKMNFEPSHEILGSSKVNQFKIIEIKTE
jgi:hypothetical protein